ncbi:MAG: valine--tRNA ligase [Rickettsiales bacterium]|jgi:valyl-tRNA synthetase|nr:valine--tRNA ligase [Rickettsiales bacterium]
MPYENNNKKAEKLYRQWEKGGYFAADSASGKPPFAIMIPPPNVTGSLHIGHAFTMTRQDMAARYRRMKGKDVLWLPGTDHAALPVEMLITRELAAAGIDKRDLGREKFIARAWEFKELHHGNITNQLRRLGCSLDWSREAFTMSPELSRAVSGAFIKMYGDGLIYRDTRLVNWDPNLLTSVSDLEVNMVEEQGTLWHIRYGVEGGGEIVVATTRPETMLGDTGIAVHPDDPRYRDFVGRFALLPLVGRRIPIVADGYADPSKGTGAVKITPAHDFNDYEVGRRHDMEAISVLDERACISVDFVRDLLGKDRFEAREIVLAMLRETGALVKAEPCMHSVPHGDRGGAILEQRLTTQWYCDVSSLAARAIEKVKNGELKLVPKVWENTWYSWLENIQPWCISRQTWWGHRIPAYYDAKGGLAYVGENPPPGLRQDDDVLDTWFSSGLWPMATLGWPDENAPDFKRYFPTQALITGFDIIFFWVARMVMFSLYFTDKVPFDTVVLHGLVTDENGVRMSKTKGNVINPLDMIDEFGIDAVRFAICAAANQNRTNPFGKKDVENAKKFLTKLLNAVAFWEAKGIRDAPEYDAKNSPPLCHWLVARMDAAIENADRHMEAYRYDEYAANIYHFVWDDFCSTFIEGAKRDMSPAVLAAAKSALRNILKILQPVVPFLTAELWERLGFGREVEFIAEPFADALPFDKGAARKFALEINRAEIESVARRIDSISRSLANEKFVANAKPEVVEEYKSTLAELEERKRILEG